MARVKKDIEETRGRKPFFDSPEILQEAIDSYFAITTEKKTISGLAYHLGFESRQSFYDYEESDLFSYTVKRARLRIESVYEANLQGNNATGSIFALKNMNWHDKTETELTNKGDKFETLDYSKLDERTLRIIAKAIKSA